ncbi:hypothetical protein GCM10009798_34710 [Nocardioides panacihumi]|uniref:Tyr recombinase domain-containing protein n=1 Tax=Nocardioides panacihumi TaxID=400774 RepID=A0ABN2RL10_9ACTN
MGRPRSDGAKSVPPVRIGKPRPSTSGRAWRVRAYAPTPGAPNGRVSYRNPETGKQTNQVPAAGETLDTLFDNVERALDQRLALAPTKDDDGAIVVRNLTNLGEIYLQSLRDKKRSEAYLANRTSLLARWVYPVIGDVLVEDWSVADSEKVLANARAGERDAQGNVVKAPLGPARAEDLGSTLAGLRQTAHMKRTGGRWLSLDENPLEGVSYGRSAAIQGASRDYVPPSHRPATEKVLAAIAMADEISKWAWMSLCVLIAAFCGLRLSEQLGLRVVDIDLRNREIDVNGVWEVPRNAEMPGYSRERYRRPHTKNRKRRTVPYPGTAHSLLMKRIREALDLAPQTTEADLIESIEKERERRADLAGGDWRDHHVATTEEDWLFPDPSGVPPTKEGFNDEWHIIRDAISWKTYIKYRNMRHHAALWWKANGHSWGLIAEYDGHDVKTLLSYYVLASEDERGKSKDILKGL